MLKKIAVLLTVVATFNLARAEGGNNGSSETAPIKRIDVYVLPYYQSAQSLDGHPTVDVAKALNAQLASNNKEDILAVRDAILSQPQRITPMTLMVLAIRLYDVELRDDAVFWFHAAKNRYITMSDVLNVKSPGLNQVYEAVKGFATLAGPFINSYAFCDLAKQHDASTRAITWTEKNPYEVMFMEQLPALPGDRSENLKKSIASLKESALKEQQYLSDPKTQEEFKRKRNEQHVPEQFCWSA
ncbi:hypothetical protein LG201_05740 [Methylobacillus gramineus]|uniref:hypothetical protein n=1 Tax=Methylobacillus gramineus TaxID=755169 RepID=UPI001CFFC9B5|nr:hypothetical protein [Methylobacillus gramineus]MCB5184700.1 hypothetical protein [Methylobacillus gramineus]